MNHDFLYSILCLIVILVFAGIIYAWVRSSSKMLNIKNNPGYTAIYSPSKINQRCSDGTGPSFTPTIFIPGFSQPPPCEAGFRCIKLAADAPYGYCKAELGVGCKTIYDCAPITTPFGPTGLLGQIFCNGVCSTRASGNVLQGCEPGNEFFSCDASQNLVCNNVTVPPTESCFNVYKQTCIDDKDCLGGICVQGTDDAGKVCYCPGLDNPVNVKICMFLDGQPCKFDQECYGGICFQNTNGTSVCQTKFFPGKNCEIDQSQVDNCFNGYACDFSDPILGGICQPIVGPVGSQTGANTNEVGSLCTSYNVYGGYTSDGTPTGPTGIQPILTCNPDELLVCNYNFTTRAPGTQPFEYLNGFGTCQPPFAKISQSCNETAACAYPGICIEDNDGVGICSRPQYFEDSDSLLFVISNDSLYNLLQISGDDLTNLFPQIKTGEYDTLIVQLVGGGGGGNYGWVGKGFTGASGATGTFDGEFYTVFYGGGGGGSGEIVGNVSPPGDFNLNPLEPNLRQYYQNTNETGLSPKPFQIDLNSFDWSNILVKLGNGGNGGSVVGPTFAQNGSPTELIFYNGSPVNVTKTVKADGGIAGGFAGPIPVISIRPPFPISTINGAGGTGYNGGGAGSGGNFSTKEALGGPGKNPIGGVNGSNSFVYTAGKGGGIGGGIGGGLKEHRVSGFSDGGGGGGGSAVVIRDNSDNNRIINTGGNGAISGPIEPNFFVSNPATPGVNFTGGGGGGGSMYFYFDVPVGQNGSAGGRGYAILKFMKIKKDINFSGQQNKDVRYPASGSSGECADGFTSNGIKRITGPSFIGPDYCIPNKGYTCNTFNTRSAQGTLCMNSIGTSADGICGNSYKLGIYIPKPPSITGTSTLSSINEFFGKWHFANLPEGLNVNARSRLSVYQKLDLLNPDFPITQVIYQPYSYDPLAVTDSKYFYYTEFSTREISPNNPFNKIDIIVNWKRISVIPASTGGRTLNGIWDIKFTSAGNIAMIVNENATLTFPYIPGNLQTSPTSFTNVAYNKPYLCNITTDLAISGETGTLTYPFGFLGPTFCFAGGANGDLTPQSVGSFPGMYFNNVLNTLPFGKFVWDLDDNAKTFCVVFYKPSTTSVYFFSQQYTGDFNQAINGNLNDVPFSQLITISISTGEVAGIPKNIKFYRDARSTKPSQSYIWDTLDYNFRNNTIGFYEPNTATSRYFRLEEMSQEVGVQWLFNQINNLASFKMYYQVTGDQYKYVNVNYNYKNNNITTEELQVEGYVPTLVSQTTSQSAYTILAMGNLDVSMYTLVQTCQ